MAITINEDGTSKTKENKTRGHLAHDYHKDPELRKTLMEIINVPGYDPASVKEAQRQIRLMNKGLPRFPKA